MSFLTPLFLLALGALAVPVLIHLTQKERKHVVAFPSLMFLRKIPYESVQRRRLRDLFLLALRLAALALIVSAFARPFLRGSDLAAAPGGARDIVVLLDRSYSMGYGDSWSRAQRAAEQALASTTPADLLRTRDPGQPERVTVTGGVWNRPATAATDVPINLEIDGRIVQDLR